MERFLKFKDQTNDIKVVRDFAEGKLSTDKIYFQAKNEMVFHMVMDVIVSLGDFYSGFGAVYHQLKFKLANEIDEYNPMVIDWIVHQCDENNLLIKFLEDEDKKS